VEDKKLPRVVHTVGQDSSGKLVTVPEIDRVQATITQLGMVMNGTLIAQTVRDMLPVWLNDDTRRELVENILGALESRGAVLVEAPEQLTDRFAGDAQMQAMATAMSALLVGIDERQHEMQQVMDTIASAAEDSAPAGQTWPIGSPEPHETGPSMVSGTASDGVPRLFRWEMSERDGRIGRLWVDQGDGQRYSWKQLNWESAAWPLGAMALTEVG
jgi:hypothetical protein